MDTVCRATFPKREHLTGDKAIADLFGRGEAFIVFPLRIVYIRSEWVGVPVRVLFAAPKRHFRHAVDRNRMKRLMREAYRRQKVALSASVEGKVYTLNVAVGFIRPVRLGYEEMYAKVGKIVRLLTERLSE